MDKQVQELLAKVRSAIEGAVALSKKEMRAYEEMSAKEQREHKRKIASRMFDNLTIVSPEKYVLEYERKRVVAKIILSNGELDQSKAFRSGRLASVWAKRAMLSEEVYVQVPLPISHVRIEARIAEPGESFA